MDILPPRRRGQLGAFSVGAGSPGSSGGFSVAASSTARPSAPAMRPPSPSVATSRTAPGPSVGTKASVPISEQVASMRAATSQAAAASKAVMPQGSKGDVYQRGQPVAVQSFVPPKGTPAITQPPKQPNESATVRAYANQIPQTPAEVVQKVLAKDAGIAVPIPGQKKLVVPDPVPVKSALLTKSPTGVLVPDGAKKTDVVVPAPRTVPSLAPAYSSGAPSATFIPGVSATTNPGFARPAVQPPPPKITPTVVATATNAAGATVGAKIAEQRASQASIISAAKAEELRRKKMLKDKLEALAKQAEEEAKKRAIEAAAQLAKARQADVSQVQSPDAQARAEAAARDALEAKALAEKQALALQAQLAESAAALEIAKQQVSATAEAADKLRAEAEAKTKEALKARDEALKAQAEASTVTSSSQAIMKFEPAVDTSNLRIIDNVLPAKPPSEGPSVWTIVLGLAAVGAIAYALDAKKQNLSGAPTLIEELED